MFMFKGKAIFNSEVSNNHKYFSSYKFPKMSYKCGTNFKAKCKDWFIKPLAQHLWSIIEGEQDLGKTGDIICRHGNTVGDKHW